MRELHVVRKGKGKPILLIHGLLSDHRQMLPIAAALPNYECFLVDLLGHGKSDKKPSLDIVTENVDFLRDLCAKHNIDTVIAFSIGGLIALDLQLKHTIFISTFCTNPLTEGPLAALHGSEPTLRKALIQNERQAQLIIERFFKKDLKNVPGIKDVSVECATQYLLAAIKDNSEAAKKLNHTIVLHGSKDSLINYSLGMRLAQAARAGFVAVPDTHLSILESEVAHEAIARFLKMSEV
jgi:pimeloyl-ACP methyl ester carboxylesterase